tara:strand:+ start:5307 stop:5555 length:249 start_codon:yes stop_codon:yes gene_type:complete
MAEKAETEVVQETPAPATATPAPDAQNTELTVNDLNNIKQIIDVASSRGAFRPNEMMTIGQVYNKLETFLATVAQQQPPQGE